MPKELLERLFANLPEVLALHVEYNQMMKERIKSNGFPIGNISDILTDMVSMLGININWFLTNKMSEK